MNAHIAKIHELPPTGVKASTRIALAYFVIASLWIVLSDGAVALIADSQTDVTWLQTTKGWGFVALTSAVLYLGIRRELRARMRAEAELRESERRLLEAQRLARLGSWESTAEEGSLKWSPELFELSGLDPREGMTYSRYLSMVHPDDRSLVKAAAARGLVEPDPIDLEYRFVLPDGTTRWVHERRCRFDDEANRPVRFAGTVQDITEQKLANEKAREAHARAEEFARHLVTVREDERRRIARELHDAIGSLLTGLKLTIQGPLGTSIPKETSERLTEMCDEAIVIVRRIVVDLRPPVLDQLGLTAALEWAAGELARRSDVEVSFEAKGDEPTIDSERKSHLFRIAQEALTNVARHAEAKHASVRVESDRNRVAIEVIDDGKGLDDALVVEARSPGLLGMLERARLVGGELTIERRSPHGTRVRVEAPA